MRLTEVVIVLLLSLLGQGPALSIWRPGEERGAGRGTRRGAPRDGTWGGAGQGGGTCELSLLGQVSRAGAAGDAHQGGGDLGVSTVHVQVAAGQGQLWAEEGQGIR